MNYSLSNYDPNWVTRFESIRIFLLGVFGEKASRVEHVGSTAIPGMKAKPCIDVLVAVRAMERFSNEREKMAEAGYGERENYIAPRTLLFFKSATDGERVENIHICETDAPVVRQFIAMRDFLRAHPTRAQEYADLKEWNARKYPEDYTAYRAGKTAFLAELECEAYEWEKNS